MTEFVDPRLAPHYTTLGLTPPVSPDQIREAYLRLVQQLHPDKLPTSTPDYLRSMAEQEFLRVQEAYFALRDAPTALSLPLQIHQEVSTPHWPRLLAAALAGSALTLGIMTGINLARSPQATVAELEPELTDDRDQAAQGIDPPSGSAAEDRIELGADADILDLDTAEIAADLADALAPAEDLSEGSGTFTPTTEQLQRFVITLREVQPILQATYSRMDQAETPEERQQIEESFDTAARKLIEANGLTPDEYQQISWAARQDPELAAAIKQVDQREMGAGFEENMKEETNP